MFTAQVGSASLLAAMPRDWLGLVGEEKVNMSWGGGAGWKGWKKNGCDNFTLIQEEMWSGKGGTGMG